MAVVGHLIAWLMPVAAATFALNGFSACLEMPTVSMPHRACGFAPALTNLRALRFTRTSHCVRPSLAESLSMRGFRIVSFLLLLAPPQMRL